jgi:hypothetical protein
MATTTEVLTSHSPKRLGYTTRTGILAIECQCDGRWRDADEHAQHQAAALATAGTGEAVDREALAVAIWPEAFDLHGVRDADGEPMTQEAQAQARATADRVLALLGARGDAAPTEVEWGVRWPNSDVEKCGAPGTADDYEDESVTEHGGVRVQRTVSAWQEVTDRGGI